jgi:ABC-type antimicrobial peptide transport system permease subunit
MSVTWPLALRYIRERRPLSAFALAALPPPAILVAVFLGARIVDDRLRLLVYANAALAVLAAWIGLTQALQFAVQQQLADFNILRETGATPAQLRRLALSEALLVSGIGMALGLVVSLVFTTLAGESALSSQLGPFVAAAVIGVLIDGAACLLVTSPRRQR